MADAATIKAIGLKISAIDDYSKVLSKASRDLAGLSKLTKDAKGGGGVIAGMGKDTLATLSSGFDKIRSSANSSLGVVGKFVPALAGLTGVGAIAGMAKVISGWEAFGSRIDLTAQSIGIPVQKLSQLQIVAQKAGLASDDMSAGLAGLNRTMNDAVWGRNAQAMDLFRRQGIAIGDQLHGMASLASVLPGIADTTQKLFKINPESANRFLDIVGVGRQLLPVFKDGAAGLALYQKQADALGPITQRQADDARKLQEAQTSLSISVEHLGYQFASQVGPALIPLLDKVTKYLTGNPQEIQEFFQTIGDGLKSFSKPENLQKIADGIHQLTHEFGGLQQILNDIGSLWLVKKLFGGSGSGGPAVPPIPPAGSTPGFLARLFSGESLGAGLAFMEALRHPSIPFQPGQAITPGAAANHILRQWGGNPGAAPSSPSGVVSSDIRNPSTDDIENPATSATVKPRRRPVRALL